MQIKSLYIENFGGISKKNFVFNSGLNSFLEENGWGKSSLASFIKAMFFGLDSSRSSEFTDRKHYLPWNEKKFGGFINIQVGKNEYKITRFFGEKKSSDVLEVFDNSTNLLTNELGENPGIKLFGLDKDAFERSVFISGETKKKVQKTDSINAKLNNLVENTDDTLNFKNAQKILSDEIKKYSSTRAESSIISDLKKELLFCKENLLEIEKSENLLKKNLKNLEDEKNKIQKINSSLKKLDEIKILFAQKKLSPEEKIELLNLNSSFKNVNFDEYEKKFNSYNKKSQELKNLEKEIESLQKNTDPQKNGAKIFFILSGIFCAAAASFLIFKFKKIFNFVPFILGIIFFIIGIVFTAKSKKLFSYKKNLHKAKKQKKILEKEIFNFQNVVLNSAEKNKNSDFEFAKIYSDFFSYKNLLKKKNEEAELEKKFNLKFEEIFSKINFLENEKSDLQKKLSTLEKENLELSKEVQKKDDEERKKLELEKKLFDAEKKCHVLENAKKFLEEADENLCRNYSEKMISNFKKYFSMFSENFSSKKEIFIDADFSSFMSSNGKNYKENFFSAGYSEISDFCTKLALADSMFEKEKPPLILDDPFFALDQNNLQSALNLVKELSQETQIIYFTCHESRKP